MKRLASELASQLALVAENHDDVWVLDGDLGDSYGVYTYAGRPLFRNFVQVGIAEQTLVGAAAGLAAANMRPWVFSFSAFLCNRAADQIRTCVIQPRSPVVLVGSHAGAATGKNGCSHAALGDVALMAALGEIEVWAPADAVDVSRVVDELTSRPRPAYVRVSREPCPPLPLPPGEIRSNEARGDALLVSTGLGSQWANEVVAALAGAGRAVPWVHLPRVDDGLLDKCFGERPGLRVVGVIEDHFESGGLADAVQRRAGLGVAVERFGWPRTWQGESGELAKLRRFHNLDTHSIVKRVGRLLA
jgi:transketolase